MQKPGVPPANPGYPQLTPEWRLPYWQVEIQGDSNTLSNNADQRSPAAAAVRGLRKHDPGDPR